MPNKPVKHDHQHKQPERASAQLYQEMSFTTPLPPPQVLERYNQVIPTFAEDLHQEVKLESKHRRSCDNWIIKGGTIRSFTGQFIAGAIAILALYFAFQLGMAGWTTTACVIGGIDLASLVGVFLGQSYFNSKKPPPPPENTEE